MIAYYVYKHKPNESINNKVVDDTKVILKIMMSIRLYYMHYFKFIF